MVAKARGNHTGWLKVETREILGKQDLENYHREYDDDTKNGRDTTRREQGTRKTMLENRKTTENPERSTTEEVGTGRWENKTKASRNHRRKRWRKGIMNKEMN